MDPNTGAVTVVQDIDRESLSENDLRLIVSVQDEPKDGQREPNVVKVPISVIILDENDNQPMFRGLPYKVRAHHMFSFLYITHRLHSTESKFHSFCHQNYPIIYGRF